jgi:hypothetical protein
MERKVGQVERRADGLPSGCERPVEALFAVEVVRFVT